MNTAAIPFFSAPLFSLSASFDQAIADPLAIPFGVVMRDVLRDGRSEVPRLKSAALPDLALLKTQS